MSSIYTITSEMLDDAKKFSKFEFFKKIRSLTTGTYDIESTRYDKLKKFNIKNQLSVKKKKILFRY